jgi:hypothetical protein
MFFGRSDLYGMTFSFLKELVLSVIQFFVKGMKNEII